jgi:hypothetical protein
MPGDVDPLAIQPPKALTDTAAGVEQPATGEPSTSAQVGGDEDDLVVVSGI